MTEQDPRTATSPPGTPSDPPGLEALMGRLRAAVARGAGRVEDSVGRSTSQLVVLQSIGDGATGVSDVAAACLTHVSSASRTVDALVRDDLVIRSVDPDDRRAVVLELTDAGAACRDEMARARDEVVDQALSGFTPSERQALAHLLDRFLTGLEQALGDDDGGPPPERQPSETSRERTSGEGTSGEGTSADARARR